MATSTPITVAHGDGIGPEIMAATLNILKGAGARLEIETIHHQAQAAEKKDGPHSLGLPHRSSYMKPLRQLKCFQQSHRTATRLPKLALNQAEGKKCNSKHYSPD